MRSSSGSGELQPRHRRCCCCCNPTSRSFELESRANPQAWSGNSAEGSRRLRRSPELLGGSTDSQMRRQPRRRWDAGRTAYYAEPNPPIITLCATCLLLIYSAVVSPRSAAPRGISYNPRLRLLTRICCLICGFPNYLHALQQWQSPATSPPKTANPALLRSLFPFP